MASIKYNNMSVFAAEQFLESVSEPSNSNLYMVFGKTIAWANDSSPPTANTMPVNHIDVWNNAIGAKRVTGFDVSHVIKRYNWTANTVYTQYDDRNQNIYDDDIKFYVMNSEYSVYKCLYNANNALSTSEPLTVSTTSILQTADNYIWKYMYTVSSSGQLRFTTDNYIPIKRLTGNDGSNQWQAQNSTVDGALYAAVISDGGTGYSNTSNLIATVTGDGENALVTLTINTASNTINSAIFTNYGTGYKYATIDISGGGGSGAVVRPIIGYPGGHSSDPIYELNGKSILVNIRLNSTEDGEFSVDNDYRQLSLIKDPYTAGTSNVSSNTVVSLSYDITVTGGGPDYILDETVYQGTSYDTSTFSGIVYDYNSANGTIKLINTIGIPINETLLGITSTATKFISSVSYPGMEKYTGKLLSISNIQPITRHTDQTESLRTILIF